MSYLVANPEDKFSRDEANLIPSAHVGVTQLSVRTNFWSKLC